MQSAEQVGGARSTGGAGRLLLLLVTIPLPWSIRRWVLVRCLGWRLDPTSRIGLSFVHAAHVELGAGAVVGHFNIVKHLDRLVIGEHSSLGQFNWVSAPNRARGLFPGQDRDASLILGRHATVTNRHYLDCSHRIEIGEFAGVAGVRSQILTHTADLRTSRQVARPVSIGPYSFVGTGSILLCGSSVGDHSVVSAGSAHGFKHRGSGELLAGVPTKVARKLTVERYGFFTRTGGYIE